MVVAVQVSCVNMSNFVNASFISIEDIKQSSKMSFAYTLLAYLVVTECSILVIFHKSGTNSMKTYRDCSE